MIQSKLPHTGTSIFSVMSRMAMDNDALNLAQGFPNFDCDPVLKDLVHHYMQKGMNQYAPMAGVMKLRKVISQKIASLYGKKIDPETDVTITAGATQALFTAITALVRPGDEVIVIEPAYDSYIPSILLNGGIPVPYALQSPDFRIDWQELRKLFTAKTKMLILNNPHNPSGKILNAEDLVELEALIEEFTVTILSDEVYEHIVFDGKEHQSLVRSDKLYKHAICCYSFGKTFHNTGWKIGYAVAPEPLMREFRKVHQFNVFSVNHPAQHAIADYLSNPENYLSLNSMFEEMRDRFIRAVSGSKFEILDSEGSYFINLDYSKISDQNDMDFAAFMTREYKLAAIPVSAFYTDPPDQKILRFCFAKTPDILEDAGIILHRM